MSDATLSSGQVMTNTELLWTRAAAHLAEGRRPWRDTTG